MSKKSCPVLSSEYTVNIRHDFLDIKYVIYAVHNNTAKYVDSCVIFF